MPPVLGKAYPGGQQDVLTIAEAIFDNPLGILFVFVSCAAGFILFGVAIWHSGALRKGAALSLGLNAPLVSSFIRPEPNVSVMLGAVLFILGITLISLDVFRRPSTGV